MILQWMSIHTMVQMLTAGYDVRHGLIGSGVYASHGYERSHVDGVKNTFELLKAYLG